MKNMVQDTSLLLTHPAPCAPHQALKLRSIYHASRITFHVLWVNADVDNRLVVARRALEGHGPATRREARVCLQVKVASSGLRHAPTGAGRAHHVAVRVGEPERERLARREPGHGEADGFA